MMLKRFLLLFSLLLFGGCSVSHHTLHPSCHETLYGSVWHLKMIDNDKVTLKQSPYLQFTDDGKVHGFSGCNHFFGKVTIDETTMHFSGPLGGTRRYCIQEAGRIERRIFSMLQESKWWQLDTMGDLVIFDDEHRLILSRRK